MSDDATYQPGAGDDDALAAEYVLGVLDREERARVAARIEREPGFAQRVADWEARLAGFDEAFAPVTPPSSVKAALDRRLFGEASAPARPAGGFWSSLALWRTVSAAALAALAVVLVLWLRAPDAPPPGDALIASLAPTTGELRFVAVYDPARGSLRVTRIAGDKPAGRDYELWLIPAGGQPISLGLVGATGARAPAVGPDLRARFAAGAQLAVSLEPEGGSPTGAPTGPVVASGEARSF